TTGPMDRDTAAPEFLTTREVAALLRVKERKVYDLAAAGEIPCRRVTGKLLFPKTEIEDWLSGARPTRLGATRPPDVVSGSHDPLLDWALRESGSGLASFFDGSLDGLDRIAGNEAIACGMHVYEPGTGDWNRAHVSARLGDAPVVLIEWAKRSRGLIVAPGLEAEIIGIAGLKGRRIALRQPKAGGQILFDHLLAEAGLTRADIKAVANPARTEADVAAAVASGRADAALGLEAMARQFRLGFVALVTERYDIAIERRAYFAPRWQAFTAFCRTPAFAAKATELGGYDLSGYGQVQWNGP
ncbi:MAG TPA: helix-turn-helix transcriptional regulator, partial [Thermohalobaculum sp.]|nr:helix-turn-helix transcriptional regulator [Thermohalobaculum sp.]